jgi:hypothetical protein
VFRLALFPKQWWISLRKPIFNLIAVMAGQSAATQYSTCGVAGKDLNFSIGLGKTIRC